jgi:DNA-binding PadR family transcriptional regulator
MKSDVVGPPPFPHFGRGDFKLFLLRVLRTQPMHGYEIMKFLEERSHGFYKPSAGSIYPALRGLVRKGHAAVAGGNGRNVYRITAKGKAFLRRQEAEFEKRFKSFEERIGPERAALFREARSIGKLFRLGLATITPGQAKKLRKILVDTRERIMEVITK